MSFVSFEFAAFFVVVVSLYFFVPAKAKWALLLVASLAFYMSWIPIFVLLLIFSIIINYVFGILIDRSATQSLRRFVTGLGIAANLLPLFYYKYFNFANVQLGYLIHGPDSKLPLLSDWNVALPIGISFFTFQALSYLIDVHRRARPAELSVLNYGLYHSYFPQLVAGPIERSTRLLPQIVHLREDGASSTFAFDADRVTSGLRLMLWGFFKKLVIADNLSVLVDSVYAGPSFFSGVQLLIATYFFAYQIYCDFSGYTDIARGVSRIFGIELMVNFDSPYGSKSIQEFWHRWHISLSTWFRDYVFIPLGGSHTTASRWAFNIMAVFVLSGLWHGASWTFVAWGALHGLYYLVSRWTSSARASLVKTIRLDRVPRLHDALRVFITFHLVTFAWVFFRANSIGDAVEILRRIAVEVPRVVPKVLSAIVHLRFDFAAFREATGLTDPAMANVVYNQGVALILIAIVCLELADYTRRKLNREFVLTAAPVWLRWSCYYALAMSIWILTPFGSRQFIYFQF